MDREIKRAINAERAGNLWPGQTAQSHVETRSANCHRRVHADWIICPNCRNRLRRVCPNCSRLVELDWSLCAWCGKDFERPELLRHMFAGISRLSEPAVRSQAG